MKIRYLKFLVLLITVVGVQGCSSHIMAIKYQPTRQPSDQNIQHKIKLVNVLDSRGTAPNWLGAIRGGYGNPLKKLYTDGDTAQVVSTAFEEALRSRGLLAPAAISEYLLDVTLQKFDTSYYFNKEAHTHFTMTLIYIPTEKTIFSKAYSTDNEKGGVGAGIFGDVDALASFANETLNENIDKALDDPDFLAALRSPVQTGAGTASVQSRLEELDRLHEKRLITEDEYNEKRKALIEEL